MECKFYNKKVEYVNKLVELLYEDLQESCGGMLHIVLDDGNMDDDDIQWCIDNCNNEKNKERHDKFLCLEIAHKMLKMDKYERNLVYYMDFGFNCGEDCNECVINNCGEFE